MNPFVHEYYIDLTKGTAIERDRRPLSQGDAYADKLVAHIQDNGRDVDLDGVGVSAKVIRYDGQTVPLTGTVEDGAACVSLDASCYAVPGDIRVTLTLSADQVVQSVLVVLLNVETSETSVVVDNGVIGDLASLLAAIADMKAATQEAVDTTAEAQRTIDDIQARADLLLGEMLPAPAIVEEAAGEHLSITDGAARQVIGLVSAIEAVQSGTGTPSPDNVRPISGWDSVSVIRTSSNILDVAACGIGTNQVSSSPTYELERTDTGVKMTLVKSATDSWVRALLYLGTREELMGQTLTAAADYASSASGNEANMALASADASDGYIDTHSAFATSGSGVTVCTGTVPEDAKAHIFLVLYLGYGFTGAAGDTVEWSNVRVNFGSAAQAWEPSQRMRLSAELPETVYGGTLDWTTGVLTVDICYVGLTGGENWWYNGAQFVANLAKEASKKVGLCSHYPYKISGTAAAMYVDGVYLAAGEGITKYYASAADWKAFLAAQHTAGTPVQVVYYLAAPYTTQLTAQQLTLLKGFNTLWSDCGDTSATYIADTKLYIDNAVAALAAGILNA